jgi:hypothetical protein
MAKRKVGSPVSAPACLTAATQQKNSLSSLRQGEVCPNRQEQGRSGHDNHLRLYSKSKKNNRMLKKWESDHIQQLLFFFMRQHCGLFRGLFKPSDLWYKDDFKNSRQRKYRW